MIFSFSSSANLFGHGSVNPSSTTLEIFEGLSLHSSVYMPSSHLIVALATDVR